MDMRRERNGQRADDDDWIFARDTESGHAEGFTIRDQHAKALELSGVRPRVIYDFRHTRSDEKGDPKAASQLPLIT